VLGRHLEDLLEAELMELHDPCASAAIVCLVDSDDGRLVGLADDAGDLAIARHQTFAAIHNEHKEIRPGNCAPAPLEHERMKRILAGAEHPAGIDQLEAGTQPFRGLRDHVACRARNRGDDRPARAAQTIEQRGLAYIWATDEHDGGRFLRHSRFLASFSGSVDSLSVSFYSSYGLSAEDSHA
jgi:hypothetical protein